MFEFTGERVVPGEVDADLWNEHVARYAFAALFTPGRRVIDVGCGTGYGTAALAKSASTAAGFDLASGAVAYAATHFAAPNLTFAQASCTALPVPDGSADVVVAFEVIEHVPEWREFLEEARRVLAGSGLLVVSTPNREYYEESRQETGPNPFHHREFNAGEFEEVLKSAFPHVRMFVQNHVAALGFQPCRAESAGVEIIGDPPRQGAAEDAHFLLALCSAEPLPRHPVRLFIPSSANVLRERERHIEMLARDRERLRSEKQSLVEMFRLQTAELEASNAWASDLDEKLRAAGRRILDLQEELQVTTAGYEGKIAELDRLNAEKTEWAGRLNEQLEAKGIELLHCIQLLDDAEARVTERTEWAMRVQEELDRAQNLLAMVRSSRWVKLGRTVGVGPAVEG